MTQAQVEGQRGILEEGVHPAVGGAEDSHGFLSWDTRYIIIRYQSEFLHSQARPGEEVMEAEVANEINRIDSPYQCVEAADPLA